MVLRLRFPLRHPLYPDHPATPARVVNALAKGTCPVLSGTYEDLMRCAAKGVRAGRAIYVLHNPESPFLTEYERDTIWEIFQVPAFGLLLDGDGRLVAYECEAHDGFHLVGSKGADAEHIDPRLNLTGEDSMLGYRIPWDRFHLVTSLCDCGRPGQRMRLVEDSASPVRAELIPSAGALSASGRGYAR